MSKFPTKRRVLIVGEGRETEYHYFVGFRSHFEVQLDATATSIKVARGRGGNARGIVEHAIKEKKKFKPDRKFGDRVYLVMDTEGPGRVSELHVAETLARKNEIEIVYSSPSIEYWFLCHFPSVPRRAFNDCDAVIAELNKKERWPSLSKGEYSKSDLTLFSRLSPLFNQARLYWLTLNRNFTFQLLMTKRVGWGSTL